eukprot:SAG31_NODE_524_length_14529_cov_23.084130_8_plen_63_part_00
MSSRLAACARAPGAGARVPLASGLLVDRFHRYEPVRARSRRAARGVDVLTTVRSSNATVNDW